jgi:hypothetical protein
VRGRTFARPFFFTKTDCKEKTEMGCKGKPKPRRWVSLGLAVLLVLASSAAWAASSMTVSHFHNSYGLNVHVIKVAAVAETDGTFTSKTINEAVASAGLPKPYYQMGYFLIAAWAVNPAATYPTSGAVTITDSTGLVLVGTGAGDTLTLSTSASGLAQLSIDRSGSQRLVTSPLTIAIGSVGSSALSTTIYIELERF